MKAIFQIWRVRDVRLALPAATLSLVGDAMAMVALTLRVHDSGAGPYAVALLLVCFSLPVVLTMGVAGDIADRVDPRVVVGLGCALQVAACLALAAWHSLPATYAFVVVLQTGFAFMSPVWSSVLTRAVGDAQVGPLVSVQHALAAVAAPVGAGLGGALVQARGDAVVFLLDGVTGVGLLVAGVLLRTRAVPATHPRATTRLLPRAGLAVVRADVVVWVLVCAMLPFVVSLESMNAVEVFLARDELGASQAQFGYWQALTGVGAVVGAGVAAMFRGDAGRLRGIVVALAAMSLAQVGSGLAPSLGWLYGFGVGLGLANAVSNAALFAVFMRRTAPGDRGKALALVNGMARTCTMLALGLGGVAASTIGPRASFVVAGCCGVAVALWAAWSLHRVGAFSRMPTDLPREPELSAPTVR